MKIHVKITKWAPAFGTISLQSKTKTYDNLSTSENHQNIYKTIIDVTDACHKKTGVKKMDENNNSWYAEIEGNNLVSIRWITLNEIREKKLKRVVYFSFLNKIINWFKK